MKLQHLLMSLLTDLQFLNSTLKYESGAQLNDETGFACCDHSACSPKSKNHDHYLLTPLLVEMR